MRESRLYGSVRGALGDRRPYRDRDQSARDYRAFPFLTDPGEIYSHTIRVTENGVINVLSAGS